MDTRPAEHPPADVLLALGSGKLDDAAAAAVFWHVEVCEECIQVAARLSGDSFLDRLRAARGLNPTPAPNKQLSRSAAAGNTAAIPTVSARPAPAILPELRDHPQYEVLRELGRGGMGVVYLAKNKLMDRLEVLKVVNRQRFDDPEAAERFLREIRSAARLNHPNIVMAYSALQVGDLLLFGMEYVEGQDLARLVKARGQLPVGNACYYAQQAASGLQHAYENKMVHRDIKPQNLILDGKKQVVKVLDFGLAKATRESGAATGGLTGPNIMMGTPDYMAPEQTRDAAAVDIRADVYGLGCTLYFLLTGRVPFPSGSLWDKLQGHQTKEPDALESLRPGLSPALAGVVRRMMAKEPAERYQRPADVVQALTPFFKVGGNATLAARPVAVKEVLWTRDTVAPSPAVRETMREGPATVVSAKRRTAAKGRKWWLIGAGVGVALLAGLIGLWAGGVFKLKTADGVLVVQVNEPNPEVYVDGERVTVSWDDGGKKAEVRVRPGTRKVEVKKDGFSVDGKELTFKDGDREIFTARLLPDAKKPDAPPVAGAADDDKGFVPLFNGKDLTGWSVAPIETGNYQGWVVEDEALVAHGDDFKTRNFLFCDREYADFVLRLEFSFDKGGSLSSGVGLRAIPGEKLPGYGRLIQDYPVLKLGGAPGAAAREETGTITWVLDGFDVKPDRSADLQPPGSWNRLEIEVKGRTIRTLVNGKQVLDAALAPGALLSDGSVPALGRPKGRIGLQKHTGTIRFRHIEIKELPSADAAATPAPPADPFQPNSVWVDGRRTLTVIERKGVMFRARFVIGDNIDREVSGTVEDGKLSWLAKDVRVTKGGAGGDNQATINRDNDGDWLAFTYREMAGDTGAFVLRLKTGK